MARDDSSRPSLACEDEARHQEILAAIQDIAAAIRERRDADDNVVDTVSGASGAASPSGTVTATSTR
jgi:hypothetical protein